LESFIIDGLDSIVDDEQGENEENKYGVTLLEYFGEKCRFKLEVG